MAKGARQKMKLLYLMKILMERTDEEHFMTISQMVEALAELGIGAERKSLYDDLEALRAFGLDVESRRGKNFGYYIASRTFELPELKLLVDAVQSSRFITQKKSVQLIRKIESLTSAGQARQLDRQVYIPNRVKTMNESIYYNVDEIHRAISEEKKISFLYSEYKLDKKLHVRRNGERYAVSPYLLLWNDGHYYLVAYYERYGGLSHFRVDKMSRITMEPENREKLRQKLDPAEYANRMFDMFGGDVQGVVVEFDEGLVGVVMDRFGRDVFISEARDGKFTAHLKVAVSPAFLSWVFQFGKKAKIISPPSVAQKLVQMAQEVAERYEKRA